MDIRDLSDDITYLSILKNAKNTLQSANRKKGQKPPDRISRKELARNQRLFQYKPSASNSRSHQLSISYISHKYPPSVAPLSALTKTYINDLCLETNHRGSYVLLRAIGPPSKSGAVMNAVEDENGGCDLIQLYNMDETRDPRKILPEGQVLIVKEPFYKSNVTGGTSIRVDHVSDVIFLTPGDNRVPTKWQPRITVDKTAMEWKEEGNTLFRDGEFHEAIECYTKGIAAAEDIIKTLKLNRSQAFISIGLYDKALEDSNHVLQSDPTNEKALLREAKALYMARKFEDCKSRLVTLLRTYPEAKDAKTILLKVYQRLQEGQTGRYNFKEMRKLTSNEKMGPVKLDCADFVGPVSLQDTADSGRGLFSTRDVEFGELLLCSKAFHVCHQETDGASIIMDLITNKTQKSSGSQLISGIVQKLCNNPSTSKEFLKLFSGNYERVQHNIIDGRPVVDTFLAYEIKNYNSFGCSAPSSATKHISSTSEPPSDSTGIGIWVMPSFINHACPGAGSARRSFIGDMMIVRAARDIKEGEQITHAYCPTTDFDARREALLKTWGFACNCSLCIAESLETSAVRKKRHTQLETILKLNPDEKYSASLFQKGIQLVGSVEGTYAKPATEQPRQAVFQAFQHLAGMKHRTTLDETLVTLHGALGALGYKIGESQDGVFIARHGSISTLLPEIFHQFSMVYTQFSKFSMAKSYHELAVRFYEVVFGERESFSDRYQDHFEDKIIP